jgi:hypothetical protein
VSDKNLEKQINSKIYVKTGVCTSETLVLWGEVSMGGYLPYIVNSYFVDLHCTLLSPVTALDTKESGSAERGKLLIRDWPSLVTSSNCRYCPADATSAGFLWSAWAVAWELGEEPLCGLSPAVLVTLASGEYAMKKSSVFEWHRRFEKEREDVQNDPRSRQPKTQRTDSNLDRTRALVLSDRRLGVRVIAEELNMGICSGEKGKEGKVG